MSWRKEAFPEEDEAFSYATWCYLAKYSQDQDKRVRIVVARGGVERVTQEVRVTVKVDREIEPVQYQ